MAKNIIKKKNATMMFYNEKEQLYLKTDALGVGLGECLIQARDRMWFPRKEACNNFRDLLQQYRKRSTRPTTWSRKFLPPLPHLRGKYDHRPQTAGGNIQERCSKSMT